MDYIHYIDVYVVYCYFHMDLLLNIFPIQRNRFKLNQCTGETPFWHHEIATLIVFPQILANQLRKNIMSYYLSLIRG